MNDSPPDPRPDDSSPPPPPEPSSPPPTTTATAPASASDHPVTIGSLVDELQQQQKATRTTVLLGSAVLLVILLLFGLGLYSAARSNLSAQQLEPALMRRVEARTPELQRKATEAVTLAMPTYQSLAREEMTRITPELRERAREEFDRLPEALEQRLGQRMQGLQQSIESHIKDQIAERFEQLPPERVESLTLHLTDELHRVGVAFQSGLEDRYTQQLEKLEAVLSQFEVSSPAGTSDQDLQLKLIENAALLVVHLAQNPDELPTLPTLQSGTEGRAETPMEPAQKESTR